MDKRYCHDCKKKRECALLKEINKVRDEQEFTGDLMGMLADFCRYYEEI